MANDPLISKTIGGCEILEVIGQGGMGVIYKSRQKSLDRIVALKVLARHLASDINFVARFQKEARAIARVNHPNILAVYDVGDDQGVNYMIMELIDGQSLAEVQSERRGAIPWEEAGDFVRQSASGLEAAQSVGIIHRDIKPENLMVTKKGVIKVSDFGLAKEADSGSMNTSVDAVMGTPAFMSPEQCDGKKVDGRSDVYSLGGTFYKLICGRLPFEAETAMSMMYRHKHEALIPPHEVVRAIPEAVSQIVVKMMAKKREHRFQTMTEVIEAIDSQRGSRISTAGRSQQGLAAVMTPAPSPVIPPSHGSPMSVDDQRRGSSIYAKEEELPPRSVGHTQHLQVAGSGPFSSEAESSSRLDMPSGMISFAGAQQDEGYSNVQRGDDFLARGDRMGALKCYRAAMQSRALDQATRTRIEAELRKEITTRKTSVESLMKRSMLVEASRECRIVTELDPADEAAKTLLKDLDQKLAQKRTLINDIRTAIAGSQFERGISLWDATPPELRDEAMGKQIEQLRTVVVPSNKLSEQGESFITQGRLEDAVSSFEDALKVNPSCEAARLGLKEAQQKIQRIEFMLKEGFQANLEQDYEKAIDTWKPILTLRPGHPQAVKSIIDASIAHAQNLKAHGDLDGALTAYQTASEADPQNRTVKRALEDLTNLADKHRALIERAQDATAHSRLGEAIGYWKEVRRINPANKKAQQQLDSLSKQRSGGLAKTFVILALLGAAGLAAFQYISERQTLSNAQGALGNGKYAEVVVKLENTRFIFLKADADGLHTLAGLEVEASQAEQLAKENKFEEASKSLSSLGERFQSIDKQRAQAVRIRAREVQADRLQRKLDEALKAEHWTDVHKAVEEIVSTLKPDGPSTDKLNTVRARAEAAQGLEQHWSAYQTNEQHGDTTGSIGELTQVRTLANQLGLADLEKRASETLTKISAGKAHVVELREKGNAALAKSPPDWKTAKEAFEELQRAEPSPEAAGLIQYARDIGYCVQEKGDMALYASANPAKGGGWGNNERKQSFCVDRYEFPNKAGEIPTANMTWLEARGACKSVGKSLCTTNQWTDACRTGVNPFPYGQAYVKDACNTEGAGPVASGSKPACVNSLGVFDMSGNLAEWTDNGPGDETAVKGGHFSSGLNSNCLDGQQESIKTKSANIGFRCCAVLPPKN